MSLIRWSPFVDTFEDLEKGLSSFVPAMDVYENEKNIVVETTLAGIKPEDVDISIKEDILTVDGTRKSTSEIDEKNYYKKEVRTGSFHRSVALPSSVKVDKVKADFKNGLLTITLPKEGEIKSKSIKINIDKK